VTESIKPKQHKKSAAPARLAPGG